VTTQRRTAGGDRVDVELRFGDVARPALVVWLELKWDAPLGRDQLRRYREALDGVAERSGARTALALITRDAGELPSNAPRTVGSNWQAVSRTLAACLAPDASDAGTYLTREFVTFLEENGLATTGAFTTADALALNQYTKTVERFGEIFTIAEDKLRTRLTPGLAFGPKQKDYAPWDLDFWRHYAPDTRAAADPAAERPRRAAQLREWTRHRVTFEWQFRWDYARGPRARDELAFAAGAVCLDNADPFARERYAPWRQSVARHGFEYVRGGEKWDVNYLMRWRYPAELVAGDDLPDQGERLADWVLESFRILASNPPPTAPRPVGRT